MKQTFIPGMLVLSAMLHSQCEKNESQVLIPDDRFLQALIERGVDTDGDGRISTEEAEKVITLDVSRDSILEMTGIEKFVRLDTLKCNDNQLTRLDLTQKTLPGHEVPLDILYDNKYYYCYLSVGNNPGLGKVCVWTESFPPAGFMLCTDGSPDVMFTTDCKN